MVNILLAEGCDDIFGKEYSFGSSMVQVVCSFNFIKDIILLQMFVFLGEINPESYAICLAEMLIKGQNAENICYQDTMKKDRFAETKMRFVLKIRHFGTPWGGKDAAEGVLMMNMQRI